MTLAEWLAAQVTADKPLFRLEEDLARACGTSGGYVRLLRYGQRKASPALAKAIEQATKGGVTRHDLRPDIWDQPVARRKR